MSMKFRETLLTCPPPPPPPTVKIGIVALGSKSSNEERIETMNQNILKLREEIEYRETLKWRIIFEG